MCLVRELFWSFIQLYVFVKLTFKSGVCYVIFILIGIVMFILYYIIYIKVNCILKQKMVFLFIYCLEELY